MFFIPSHLLHLSQNIIFSNLSEELFNTYPSLNARNQFLQLHKTTCKVIVLYVCILVIVILDKGGKDKRPEVNVSQHGKEMHVAFSYTPAFCVPHTFQRQHLTNSSLLPLFVFVPNAGSCREPTKHVNRCKTLKFPFSFLFFCLVFYRIFWSFLFQFQHSDV